MELRFSGPHSYPIPPPFRLPARVIPRKRHSNLDRVVTYQARRLATPPPPPPSLSRSRVLSFFSLSFLVALSH